MIVVYAVLALLGLVVPWWFNLEFIHAHGGFSWATFIGEAFSTPASRSIAVDLSIACAAWLVWMVREARALRMRYVWLYIALVFVVAFAFACPLFLFMRERRLRATAQARL